MIQMAGSLWILIGFMWNTPSMVCWYQLGPPKLPSGCLGGSKYQQKIYPFCLSSRYHFHAGISTEYCIWPDFTMLLIIFFHHQSFQLFEAVQQCFHFSSMCFASEGTSAPGLVDARDANTLVGCDHQLQPREPPTKPSQPLCSTHRRRSLVWI